MIMKKRRDIKMPMIEISDRTLKIALSQQSYLKKHANKSESEYIDHLIMVGVITACNAQAEREEMGLED